MEDVAADEEIEDVVLVPVKKAQKDNYYVYLIRSVNTCENIHSNLNIANKSIRSFLFTISNNSIYQM